MTSSKAHKNTDQDPNLLHPQSVQTLPTDTSNNNSPQLLPKNGFHDSHAEDVLKSELDDLDDVFGDVSKTTSSDKSKEANPETEVTQSKSGSRPEGKLSLDLNPGSLSQPSPPKVVDVLREEEWLLLDLCYGLPLFNTQLNKAVCSRITKLGLFKQNR